MRPIYLKLAGLQSYRETQDIDFVSLGETGIFGIFGPTGSGKSSILDAITLALYGRVERAKNRTGIMNDSEKILSVSFTFDIGSMPKRTRYRVERRYKRGEGSSVTASLCRLFRYENGTEVPIADKEQEVNPAIRQIVGLTVEDFTRAVVLPQGKFAEFLTLTGGDRTKMLQRIFSLEDYGQTLSERIKKRADGIRTSLSSVEGQQIGLGDCSPQNIVAAQNELAAAQSEADDYQAQYTSLRYEYEEKKELLNIIEELKVLQGKREQHENGAKEHLERSQLLKRAEAAEPLRPLIISRDNARARRFELQGIYDRCVADFERAKEISENSARAYQSAKEILENEEPSLHRKRAALENALKLEEELNGISVQLEETTLAYDELENKVSEQSRLRDALTYRLGEMASELQGSEQELTGLRVDPEARAKLQEAKTKAAVFRGSESALNTALNDEKSRVIELIDRERLHKISEERFARLKELWEKAKTAISEHIIVKPIDDASIAFMNSSLTKLESVIDGICRLSKELLDHDDKLHRYNRDKSEMLLRISEQQKKVENIHTAVELAYEKKLRARSRYDDAIIIQGAASLAQHLTNGEPCPVCGSKDHPMPVDTAAAEQVESIRSQCEEAEEEEDRIQKDLNQAREELARYQTSLDNLCTMESDVSRRREAFVSEEDELRKRLPSAWRNVSVDDLIHLLSTEKANCHEASGKLEEWSKISSDLSEKEADLRSEMTVAGADYVKSQAEKDASKTALEQALERSRAARAGFDRAKSEFEAISEGMTLETVEKESVLVLERDLRYRRLSATYEEKRRSLADLQTKVSSVDIALAEAKQRLLSIADNIFEKKRARHSLCSKLDTETGGVSANKLIEDLDRRLSLIKGEVSRLETDRINAEAVFQKVSNQLASCTASLTEAKDRLDESISNLDAIISGSEFTSVEDAVNSLMMSEEKKKLFDEVNLYIESGRILDSEWLKLENARAGRELEPSEWQAFCESLKQVENNFKVAGQAVAVISHNLNQLTKAKERWDVLEKQRTQLNLELGRLQKLQNLFKANAFVQFLSEEQMSSVVSEASSRLAFLTGQRYRLEIAPTGDFAIRDYMNGGCLRPVSTLSGGETFLTSLSLALALSSQIQLKGDTPLEFFFLDEGFGTLDQELLETVMTALERLHMNKMLIGIISHVPELRARIARRLAIEPPNSGNGSKIRLEIG